MMHQVWAFNLHYADSTRVWEIKKIRRGFHTDALFRSGRQLLLAFFTTIYPTQFKTPNEFSRLLGIPKNSATCMKSHKSTTVSRRLVKCQNRIKNGPIFAKNKWKSEKKFDPSSAYDSSSFIFAVTEFIWFSLERNISQPLKKVCYYSNRIVEWLIWLW